MTIINCNRIVDECRCCGGKNLHKYLDLGTQPLANGLHKEGETQLVFPLEVNVCLICFHSQLSIIIDPTILYSNYLYVTGVSRTFEQHCRNLAESVVGKIGTGSFSVLDIGCNDGTLLEEFRKLGADVVGVDPAKNLRPITEAKGIPVFVETWSMDTANNLHSEFDVITSTNSFAHVDDNIKFLEACRMALAKDGLVVVEIPYLGKLIEGLEFDTIYHEHISYFTVNSFQLLAERCGFTIVDLTEQEIHGGSLRFYLRKSVGVVLHCDKICRWINRENEEDLFHLARYKLFASDVAKLRDKIKTMLADTDGKKIGYGASAKGNVMLNYCNIDLDYIVDDTPQKQGLLTPSRDIPVRGRWNLAAEPDPVNIFILPWNFTDEIVGNLRQIRPPEKGDYWMVHRPTVKRVPLWPKEEN